MENKNNDINISIIKGDKLFNLNTPFVINLSTEQPDENDKKSNADLICVIDISGSMYGEKIMQVRESLKILLNLMDEKDRLCLILFNDTAHNYFNLQYLTKKNKEILIQKINEIDANGGTNILSGLEIAIDIIKKESNNNNKNVSSILLLSDGRDNFSDDIQLAEAVKNLTKGFGLSFTLNTLGYGDDHDAKIMNKLANLRDGSFFYVENYSKISEYFVSILGACVSVISRKVDLKLNILNNNCKIMKVYGENNLYYHQSNIKSFQTSMLQFICGKEYTFVLEILVDESKININDEILNVEINYEDITQNDKKIKKGKKYIYKLKDLEYMKANEEYIRVFVYYILDEAMKLKEQNQNKKGKQMLEKLENWIINNYKGNNINYIKDIKNAKGLFSDNEYTKLKSFNYISCSIQENSLKRSGKTMTNCNSIQLNMLNSIPKTTPIYNPNQMFYNKMQMGINSNSNPNPIKSNHFPLRKYNKFININPNNNNSNKRKEQLDNINKNKNKFNIDLTRSLNLNSNNKYTFSFRDNKGKNLSNINEHNNAFNNSDDDIDF
jgi:Mg-chelatase subunit ChlD